MCIRSEIPLSGRWCLPLPALLMAAFSVGCGEVPQTESEVLSADDAETPVLNAELFAQGEQVFNTTCTECHSTSPPPKLAPPMLHVAGHYLQEFESRDEAQAAVETWLSGPDAEHSALPEHAIERFGLMPPQALPADDAAAVAYYVFELYDAEGGMGEMGEMGEHEMGGMGGMGEGGMGEGHRMEGRGGMEGMGEGHRMEGRGGMGRGGEGAGMGDTTRMRRRGGGGR